jgi:uncharacterized protein
MSWLYWIFGLLGHAGIWATVFNQLHATSCPRSSRKFSEKFILLMVFVPPLLAGLWLFSNQFAPDPLQSLPAFQATRFSWIPALILVYVVLCIPIGGFFFARWFYRRMVFRVPAAVRFDRSKIINIGQLAGRPLSNGWFARSLGLIPFNQVELLDQKRLELALDIPEVLDGFRICHLSDLHLTGQLDQEYFRHVVDLANQFRPQLTVITGDLVDKDRCLPWLTNTVGQLNSDLGCLFVLGNHDRLVRDQNGYLETLAALGLKRLHSQWTEIEYRGATIRLAGNELPWYAGAEKVPELGRRSKNELRILLTHSPDQLEWALKHDFNLVLAGHNHGGQIRFPFIGAIIVPSRYGVKYAAGTFEKRGLLMHVSRGISGDEPIRIGCLPELGLITLRSTRVLSSQQR